MLFKDVIICDIDGERRADIRVNDGLIIEIDQNLDDKEIIECNGSYLLPSITDLNVRVKDSNLSGNSMDEVSINALKGGVSTIALMPDSKPSVSNEIVLEFVQNHTQRADGADIKSLLFAINDEGLLSNIAVLLKKGAVAPYVKTRTDNNLVCKIAEYVKMYNCTLFVTAEDKSLKSLGVMREGEVATNLGLAGVSPLSEVLHVSRMIEIAKFFDIPILFKSISIPRSIELITKAKEEGVKVSCEVSIHHLLHSDESCCGFNTTAKLDPPLANRDDMLLLQKYLKESKIDILTSSHQPSSRSNKDIAFYDADYGCESISEALALYFSKLVKTEMITLSKLVELTSKNTSSALGIKSGKIEVGMSANFTLFDQNKTTTVDNYNSLYNTEVLSGRVTAVMKEGNLIRWS